MGRPPSGRNFSNLVKLCKTLREAANEELKFPGSSRYLHLQQLDGSPDQRTADPDGRKKETEKFEKKRCEIVYI